jgi:chromosome segregation ATPase
LIILTKLPSPSTTETEREQQERRALATKWGNELGKVQVEKDLRTIGKESLEQKVERLQQEKGAVEKTLESVGGELKNIKGELKSIKGEFKTKSEEVEEAKNAVDEKQAVVDALKKVLAEERVLKEKMNADLTREKEKRSNELQEERKKLQDTSTKLKIADSKAEALDRRINKIFGEKTDMEEGKRAAEKSLQDLNAIIIQLRYDVQQATSNGEQQFQTLPTQSQSLVAQIRRLQGNWTLNKPSTNASRTISEIQYRCIPDKSHCSKTVLHTATLVATI